MGIGATDIIIEWLSKTNSWPTLEEMIARYGKEEAIQNDPLNPVQTWILARKPVKICSK